MPQRGYAVGNPHGAGTGPTPGPKPKPVKAGSQRGYKKGGMVKKGKEC